jgi:hypothetical protein
MGYNNPLNLNLEDALKKLYAAVDLHGDWKTTRYDWNGGTPSKHCMGLVSGKAPATRAVIPVGTDHLLADGNHMIRIKKAGHRLRQTDDFLDPPIADKTFCRPAAKCEKQMGV